MIRIFTPCVSIAAVVLLAACAVSQPPSGATSVMPQTLETRGGVTRDGSWMLPEAKRDDLLYVSDTFAGVVHVLAYPAGREVGMLVVGGNPEGECVDGAGNVWITRFRTTTVVEYAHGSTNSTAFVSTYPNTPWGCAVDPTTGNLAVTNTEDVIDVYAGARGNPTPYSVPGDDLGFQFCTYDDSGDLFASAPYSNIAELPKGSSEMTNMQLTLPVSPWSVQWDHQRRFLTVAGPTAKSRTTVYHVRVSGAAGRVIGSTALDRARNAYAQYWIDGTKIVGISANRGRNGRSERLVQSWPYPAGGAATQSVRVKGSGYGTPDLVGVVVSKAAR